MTRYAIVSVTNKAKLKELSEGLTAAGISIISSSNTAAAINAAGYPVLEVSEYTGFPEGMGGRLKTINPKVAGGILSRRDDTLDVQFAAEHGIVDIDFVFVNLYDFAGNPGIEQIDIGGPTLIRSAVKNHKHVVVVVDVNDYEMVLAQLANGGVSDETRLELARKAIAYTAAYDAAIVAWFDQQLGDDLPPTIHLTLELQARMKYGENPGMTPAGHYAIAGHDDPLGLHHSVTLEGSPSFNLTTDQSRSLLTLTQIVDGCIRQLGESPYAAVIVKHGNPCGVAVGDDEADVLRRALECDLVAVHGGVITTNFAITEDLAKLLLFHAQPYKEGTDEPARRLIDGVFAPSIDDAAVRLLHRKDQACRMLVNPDLADLHRDTARRYTGVRGGMLVQPPYPPVPNLDDPEYAIDGSNRGGGLTIAQRRGVVVGQAIAGTSNSNTIALMSADGLTLVGLGVSQQDRVGAARLAIARARASAKARQERGIGNGRLPRGLIAVSDGFFPYVDAVLALIRSGVRFIVAPSGSRTGDGPVAELARAKKVTLLWRPDMRFFSNHSG